MAKERDKLEDLVKKGVISRGGSLKGKSIEAVREEAAARIRARMPEGIGGPKLVLIVDREKAGYLDLPLIEETEVFLGSWTARYNEVTGAIYTTRWTLVDLEEGESGMKLPHAESFFVVHAPRIEVDLENLPKSWRVVRLIPQHVWDGIEGAMRQQDELAGLYGAKEGIEQLSIETFFSHLQDLTNEYLLGEVNEAVLTALAEETSELFEREGLVEARDYLKKTIYENTLRALKKDSLDRINPMVARVLLRSSYLRVVKREVVIRLVREKAMNVFLTLVIEREGTRRNINNCLEALDTLAGVKEKPGSLLFTQKKYLTNKKAITDRNIDGLRRALYAVVKDLRRVRVAPYLLPARIAEVVLTGVPKGKVKKTREVLSFGSAEGVVNETSALTFVKRKDMKEARRRMRQAYNLLASVLDDPDNKEYRVY